MRFVRPAVVLVMLVMLASCSGGGKGSTDHPTAGGSATSESSATAHYSLAAYRCTPAKDKNADAEIAACKAKGENCNYTQALVCYGTPPPASVEEAERKAREDGTVACACVCPADVTACHTVP